MRCEAAAASLRSRYGVRNPVREIERAACWGARAAGRHSLLLAEQEVRDETFRSTRAVEFYGVVESATARKHWRDA